MHLSGGWNVLRRGRAVGHAEVAWTQYLCGQRGATKKIRSQEAGTLELCVRMGVQQDGSRPSASFTASSWSTTGNLSDKWKFISSLPTLQWERLIN